VLVAKAIDHGIDSSSAVDRCQLLSITASSLWLIQSVVLVQ